MKKIFLILSLIALLVFSSCEFGTPEAEKSYYKGAIEIGTSSSSLTRSLENQYKKEFESGDMISVFVYQEGKTDPVADNAILKYDGTGAWTEVVYREAVDEQAAGYFEASEEEKKMAWTGEGGAYTFIATYPAITNDIKITDGKVSFDLYNNPTQLFVGKIKDKAAPTTAEEAKVTLTLDPLLGGVQTMSDLAAGMSISAQTAFTFDVATGEFIPAGETKSLSFSTKDEDGYYCSPLLIPQEITISGNGFRNTLNIDKGTIITIKEETKVESISLDKSLDLEFIGKSGETYTLNPTYTPDDAYTKNAVWKSSDESVATVENGKVTAVGFGSATITLSVGEVSAECQVNVTGIKFGSGVSSVSEKEYTVTGTYDTLTEPLVTVCGDYTITLNGITVGSESSRVTQPIVRVMGGTPTIKLSGKNTVYASSVFYDGSPSSRSVIHLVGENANVKIVGDLGTGAATSTESPTNPATLIIDEYMKLSSRNFGYDHDALIGGSAGDTIGNITIENAIIKFIYSCSRFFSGALIGSGSYSEDASGNDIAGSTGELKVSNSIINAELITTTSTALYSAVIGSGSYSTCDDITVDGSKITLSAKPYEGGYFSDQMSAVIGAGTGYSSNNEQYDTPNITVTNSNIALEYSKLNNFKGAVIGNGQANKVGDISVKSSELNLTCPAPISGSIIGTGIYSLYSKGNITVDSTYITVDTKENSIGGGSIIGVGENSAGTGGSKRGSISVSGGTITIKNLKDIYGCVIGVGRSDTDTEAKVENITVDGVEINIDKVTNVTTKPDAYPLGVVIGVGPGGSYCDGIIEIKNFKGISIDTVDGSSPVQPFIGSCNGSHVEKNININLSGNESQDSFLSKITLTKNGVGCTFPDDFVKVGCVGNNEDKVIWVTPTTGTASTN